MNMLFVGSDYLPYRNAGEKNFWLELVEVLKYKVGSIRILSVNRDYVGRHFQAPNVDIIYSASPFIFPMRTRFADPKRYIGKSIRFLKFSSQIIRSIKEDGVNIVHFMDNYGPVTVGFKSKLDVPLSIFAPTYDPRYPLYDYFLKLSLTSFDKIVTTTNSFKSRLINLGISKDKIEVIRWGVNTLKLTPNFEMKRRTKEELGINQDLKIILWSGFLQQIRAMEFQYSLQIAKEVLKQTKNCVFIFALKKTHFREQDAYYEKKGTRILVTRSNKDFLKLVNASDAFLSPILAEDSIAAPPLTWIECMVNGVPILTTNVRGADELVSDGRTGYIFKNTKDACKKIQTILTDETSHRKVCEESRKLACREHDVKAIAAKYMDMWKKMGE